MKKLRSILQSNVFLIILLAISLSYCLFYNIFTCHSVYDIDEKFFEGEIIDLFIDGNYLSIQIKAKEKIQCSYYFNSQEEKENFQKNYQLGDIIAIEGTLIQPNSNTNFNLFNYKKYLYYERIFYTLTIEKYSKIGESKNLLYKFKNILLNRIDNNTKTGSYLNALLLGDDRYIQEDITNVYQQIGISHLFAISGMHIGLLSGILLFFFKKISIPEIISSWIVIFFLLFYLLLTGGSPSVIRAVTLFVLLTMNKMFRWKLSSFRVFLFTILFMVIIDPFIIFKVGFQFSSTVSGMLMLFSCLIKRYKNYFCKLFMTSFIAFLAGMPICLYHFHQINVLSVFYNLFFVPWMSVFLFPMTLLTFIFPVFDKILFIIISILEFCASWCSRVPSCFIFRHPSLVMVILYFIVILWLFFKWEKSKGIFLVLLAMLIFHYHYNILVPSSYMLVIDIGQGDSILLHSKGKSILVDTGGRIEYSREEWQKREHSSTLAGHTLIPILKSLGIRQLDYLVFSHGDQDHLGEGANIINNFKIKRALFNDGELNHNEKKIISVLEKKGIPFSRSKKKEHFTIGDFKFLSLNSDLQNENDSSIVFKVEINDKSILLMGDASIKTEVEILKEKLGGIDILKVGHHGSKTSSGKKFIKEINPKYSIISVGKNRYGHPNKEALENLENSTIYRTDKMGSILFNFKKQGLEIKTCMP